jgi:trehalose 6-phosphate synthase
MVRTVIEINTRFRTPDWTPIVLVNENVSAEMLAGVFRAADLCLVSSLQDGMNLVAKEFIACQVEERGVLVLSRFTGAAEEIDGAILINPFNIDGFVEGIRRALEMSEGERKIRMHRMRTQLRQRTIFDWLEAILSRTENAIATRSARSPATS